MKIALTGGERPHRPGDRGGGASPGPQRRQHRSRRRRPRSAARRTCSSSTADICDYEQLLAAFEGCDALIHMAAIPSPVQASRSHRPQQQCRGQLQRAARRGRARHHAHLPGLERQRDRALLQPRAALRLFPDRRGAPELQRGALRPLEVDLRSSRPTASRAATRTSASRACGSTGWFPIARRRGTWFNSARARRSTSGPIRSTKPLPAPAC